jgi:hypothetical protein
MIIVTEWSVWCHGLLSENVSLTKLAIATEFRFLVITDIPISQISLEDNSHVMGSQHRILYKCVKITALLLINVVKLQTCRFCKSLLIFQTPTKSFGICNTLGILKIEFENLKKSSVHFLPYKTFQQSLLLICSVAKFTM